MLNAARKKVNDWIDIEEIFWKTKSRDQTIKLGDINTKFFHWSTKRRTRRNIIKPIQDENDNWIQMLKISQASSQITSQVW